MSYNVGLDTHIRPLNTTQATQLNVYGRQGRTFQSFGSSPYTNSVIPRPSYTRPRFTALSTNPLNNAIPNVDPGVVTTLVDQSANRTVDITHGDMVRSVPQTGRQYRNLTMSLPANLPMPHLAVNNKTQIRHAQEAMGRKRKA